jgi:long-chain fatty acid transport protein
MMRKLLFSAVLALVSSTAVQAGGLMTNTNYHIAFDRMFARGATSEIDATFSNPAGLAWGREGFQLSLNFQKPWQRRDIELNNTTYEGVASAPIVPALFAAYKKDRIALSAMIGIVGSGGFVKYDQGVPQYNVMVQSLMNGIIPQLNQLPGINIPTNYALNSEMKGKQYIYGGQLNFTYKLLDCLSAAVGVRVNYYDGYYRGHVIADAQNEYGQLAKLLLDVDQKGWGFTPLVSINYHQGPLTLSARYEFRTKLNPENSTNVLDAGLGNGLVAKVAAVPVYGEATLMKIREALAPQMAAATAPFQDGACTRYDMPALLAVAAGYEFTPKLRAALEYHFFDDKNAKMANNRQEKLTHGTNEFLAGIEGDLNDRWTLSWGIQRTDYGISDDYEQNTSFACDSWSIGLGAAVKLTEKLRLNVGYFTSIYEDYTKQCNAARDGYNGEEIYSRTNHVIGVGIDWKF